MENSKRLPHMRESNPHVRVIVIKSQFLPPALNRYSPTSFRPITARICLPRYFIIASAICLSAPVASRGRYWISGFISVTPRICHEGLTVNP